MKNQPPPPAGIPAQPPAAGEAACAPELYWNPCPDTNRAFLSLAGVDNNVAEVFPVEHLDYISAADVACRIARRYNSHAALVEALEALLEQADMGAVDDETAPIVEQARAALSSAKEST